MPDVFRPWRQPARLLYDAFQKEAVSRPKRRPSEWMAAEQNAIWAAARDYAQQQGLRVLTLAEIQKAESPAVGHIDYGAKWAYGIAKMLGPAYCISKAEARRAEHLKTKGKKR